MPDILLIQPPIEDFYLTAKRTIPYGLASIAASLLEEGFSVEILDALATSKSRAIPLPEEMAYLEVYYGKPDISPFGLFHTYRHYGYSHEHIARKARESGAMLIGISSLFTAYSDSVLKTARAVKRFHPRCSIVVGGHHATELPLAVLECEAVDFVLRGEGEASMPLLASALLRGGSLEDVPGLLTRQASENLQISEPTLMENLSDTPLPAHHLISRKHYQRGGRGTLAVVASRGCPFQCTYCSTGRSSCIKYRRRSLRSVYAEIEAFRQQGPIGFIEFEDENISLEKRWFLDLLRFVEERFQGEDVELRAMNGLYPPTLDEEVITAMKRAGFKTLNLSLGTVCPEQLRRFARHDVKDSFERACSLAHELGMEAVGYIIVGAPGQCADDSLQDLLFLAGKPVLAGVSVYYPAPGSADFETCKTLGLLPPSHSLMRSTALPISHTTTRLEAVTLLRLGRILNFMKYLQKKEISPDEASPVLLHDLPWRDRTEVGSHLLQAFLEDSSIRGMTPSGEIYLHNHCHVLSTQFVKAHGR